MSAVSARPVRDKVRGRLPDLSWAAAARLGMTALGLAKVKISPISCITFLPLQTAL